MGNRQSPRLNKRQREDDTDQKDAATARTPRRKIMEEEKRGMSLDETMAKAFAWGTFVTLLGQRTPDSLESASAMAATLHGGSLDLVEPPGSSEAICNWARGVSSSWTPAWSEAKRKKVTDGLWAILEKGGAIRRLNVRGVATVSDGNFYPPLHVALGYGALRAVERMLLCPELDMNSLSQPIGETPAMHCVRYPNYSAECFELMLTLRFSDIDLDLRAADGQNTSDKINAITGTDANSTKIRAAWNGRIHWLRHQYYPQIHQFLTSQTPLLSQLVVLIGLYLRPKLLYPKSN